MRHSRPHLAIERGELKIGGISAKALADRYGTPLYVTDLDRVSDCYETASGALRSEHRNTLLAFAYKSNSTRALIERLSDQGAGATVVSVAGIELARECHVNPAKIVFDGPSKSREEISAAIKARVGIINAESTQEVLDIDSICARLGVKEFAVGFRVNFGIEAATHRGLATGSGAHKFGVPREEVIEFCEKDAPDLKRAKVVGLHSHIGSQMFDPSIYTKQTEEMVRLADELHHLGVEIKEFNFGGGLGIDYGDEGKEIAMGEYARATAGTFKLLGGKAKSRLIFELGRWVVADSTVLLTRVNYVKTMGTTNWALVDAGMNDFMRPALYGAYHEIVPAHVPNRAPSGLSYNVGGPICESTDVFGSDRKLGVRLSQGDVLAILDVGAYGTSMASTYNMRPLPRTVLVSKRRHRLVPLSWN